MPLSEKYLSTVVGITVVPDANGFSYVPIVGVARQTTAKVNTAGISVLENVTINENNETEDFEEKYVVDADGSPGLVDAEGNSYIPIVGV